MRDATGGLIALLLSKAPSWTADLFTITLADATALYWTSADTAIIANSHIYSAQGPLLQRTKWSMGNTMQSVNLEVKLAGLDTDFADGQMIKLLIHNGGFDGARLRLDRAFMPTPGDVSLGTVMLWDGRMGEAKITGLGATLTVTGETALFNQYLPRNQYLASCLHRFFDAGCTRVAADYTLTTTIGAAPSVVYLPWSTMPSNPASYTLGYVTVTSGPAIGQRRSIKVAGSGGVILAYPLYDLPIVGDGIEVVQGCNKTLQRCGHLITTAGAHIDNSANFRAFPFTPNAETAY